MKPAILCGDWNKPDPLPEKKPEADQLSEGTISLAGALAELSRTLPGLKAALERQASPPVDRMTLRLDELATALGVSRRVLERERSAGRFPAPDLSVGRMPLWKPQTIRAWIEGGGRR
jgi:hypothetical protein